MPEPPTAADVASILADAGVPSTLGWRALPPDRGSPNRTHVYVLDDVVVKLDQSSLGRIEREVAALGCVAGTGLPVPEVVGVGELADGRSWIVMTRLPGEPPADALRPAHELDPALAGRLGSLAARLHSLAPPPASQSMLERAERLEALLTRMSAEAQIVAETEWRHALSLVQRQRGALGGGGLVFAHRDLQPRNVLVDAGGDIVGLLDFESAGGSDPADDFSRVGLDWTAPGFGAFVDGYAAGGGVLGADAAERVSYFVLVWAFVTFAYLGAHAPAYLPVARTTFARFEAGERPPLPVL